MYLGNPTTAAWRTLERFVQYDRSSTPNLWERIDERPFTRDALSMLRNFGTVELSFEN